MKSQSLLTEKKAVSSRPAAYSEFNGVCVDFIRQALALTECQSHNESLAMQLRIRKTIVFHQDLQKLKVFSLFVSKNFQCWLMRESKKLHNFTRSSKFMDMISSIQNVSKCSLNIYLILQVLNIGEEYLNTWYLCINQMLDDGCCCSSVVQRSKTTSIESYLEDFVQKLRLRNVQPSEKGHVVHNGFSGPKEHTNTAAIPSPPRGCRLCLRANLLAKMLAMTLLQITGIYDNKKKEKK